MSFDRLQHIIIFFNRQILWPFRLETCSNGVVVIATFGHERWMIVSLYCLLFRNQLYMYLTDRITQRASYCNKPWSTFLHGYQDGLHVLFISREDLLGLTTVHNFVCKNDVYKIPEVLFISLTLNLHFRKEKINQYVPHILDG